ncbi:hypothetical protein BKA65DRAFT_410994, partial [Rhexocercosporidium sp. MPI-PUGE-AT-0058]
MTSHQPLEQESSFATSSYEHKNTKGTMEEWHRRFGHASLSTLQHLQEATSDLKITTKSYDENCEVCKKTKSQQIISRRPASRASAPYERIHFDLIPMNEGYSGEEIIAHFLCDLVRINHVYVLPNKRQGTLLNTLEYFTAYVERLGFNPLEIRVDGERGLGKDFDNWVAEKGYIIELVLPYTKELNSNIERSG